MKYGDLVLEDLQLDFAHYTPRRGRGARTFTPQELPKKFWRDGIIQESPSSMFFIIDNNGLTIAPTASHEIEYPIIAQVLFEAQEQAEAATDMLYEQGLEVEQTLPLQGTVKIIGDGTWEMMDESAPEPEAVIEVPKEVAKKPKSTAGGLKLVTQQMIDNMFGLTFGDLIEVYNPKDERDCIGQYIYIMGYNVCPRLKNVKTEKDIDLYFLADHPYKVIKHAPDSE